MATPDKDTIYIDIDDEITGIIDKLKASDGKVVALVLPKRAAVFQSIVNMKLLKRAADASKKNPVLITSEAGLLPLAGMAGVHVAKTLTSKPEIPAAPQAIDDAEETVQEDANEAEAPLDPTQPVGKLAGPPAAAGDVETLTLDDEDLPPEADTAPAGPKSFDPPAKGKNKKLKIPNFERFRLWLFLGGLIILIIIGAFVFASISLQKATISIKTDATNVDANLNLNLAPGSKTLDPASGTLPAKLDQQQKTYTQQVPTTGQKNNGNKASGSVTLTNCSQSSDATIPAGTGFSSGGNTFISQQDATVPTSDYNKGACQNKPAVSVSVIAQNGGSGYNLPAGAKFSVSSSSQCPSSCTSQLSAQGGTISGGTDSIVQSVNQNDINSAKAKIVPSDSDIKSTLTGQLQKEGYYPLAVTYVAGTPAVTNSANVGDIATTVTVTETITYTMFGVYKADLQTLLDNNIKSQIDAGKQVVLDDGLGKANITVNNISASGAQLSLSTTGTAGPDLTIDTIKQQAAGQKIGAIKSQLQNNPDVTSVDVKLSPFWSTTVPKKTDKITVTIAKPTTTKKATSSNGSTP